MDALVSTQWLAERLGRRDVRVVDGSWHMPQLRRDARAEFATAHIPGAVFADAETDLAGAGIVAERLRQSICNESIQSGEKNLNVSISLGVSQIYADCPHYENLISRAEKASSKLDENRMNKRPSSGFTAAALN